MAFRIISESAWVHIVGVGPEDWANWSPDGKTLYFTSMKADITVCGGSGSTQAPAGRWANLSRCCTFTVASTTGISVGRQPGDESLWC